MTRPLLTRASPSLSSVSSAPARISSGLLLAEQAAVHHVLRGEDDAAQDGLVLDDADVAVEVGNLRQAVVERDEIAEAVAGFELVELHQLIGDGDAVDRLAALVEIAHAAEDAAVLFAG